jgi:hypothetical protein
MVTITVRATPGARRNPLIAYRMSCSIEAETVE